MTDPEPTEEETVVVEEEPLNPANPAEVPYHNVNYIPAEEEEVSPPESDSPQADSFGEGEPTEDETVVDETTTDSQETPEETPSKPLF